MSSCNMNPDEYKCFVEKELHILAERIRFLFRIGENEKAWALQKLKEAMWKCGATEYNLMLSDQNKLHGASAMMQRAERQRPKFIDERICPSSESYLAPTFYGT